MTSQTEQTAGLPEGVSAHGVVVLLIDDQAMVGEAVRRMLAPEQDIEFHYCQDPTQAIAKANEVNPTVILQDLVMPEIDGLMLVRFFRANSGTKEVPLIVLSTKEEATTKAEAFARGANDYLVKLPDRIELVARIRYHSKGYVALLERNEAYRQLAESQRILAEELALAEQYVVSLLPPPQSQPIRTEWQYIPSMQLGGDAFGYHWLDDDRFVIFLFDVAGHGVGAALLSVSVMNVLRSQTLPNVDFSQPDQVLAGVNQAFPMEEHDDRFFTIWYGVFNRRTRSLCYASGGHHATLMLHGDAPDLAELTASGLPIGVMPESVYPCAETQVPPGAKLYVFSDGVFEIARPDGSMWTYEEFCEMLCGLRTTESAVEAVLETVREIRGGDVFDDDFSLLEIVCP